MIMIMARALNHGGAIFASDKSSAWIGATFESNHAGGDGGGVASIGKSALNFLQGTLIRKNQAGNRAGGIFVGGFSAYFCKQCQVCVAKMVVLARIG